jgi:hypothetical protein
LVQRQSDKHLKLRGHPNSRLGKTLAYIQSLDTNTQSLASQTLESRFLPFAIEQNDPQFRAIAIQCATECEAWAKAIREYAALPISSLSPVTGQHCHLDAAQSPSQEKFSVENSSTEAEQDSGSDVMRNMGLL